MATPSEQTETRKKSIFQCKTCQNDVEVNKKPKKEKVTAENVEAKSDIVEVTLTPSKLADKKYSVKIGKKTINFGQKGASDYTINTDPIRKQLYINRHIKREEQFWSPLQSNLETASFWSRYLLWESPDIFKSITDIEERMGCKIQFNKATIEKYQRKLNRLSRAYGTEE